MKDLKTAVTLRTAMSNRLGALENALKYFKQFPQKPISGSPVENMFCNGIVDLAAEYSMHPDMPTVLRRIVSELDAVGAVAVANWVIEQAYEASYQGTLVEQTAIDLAVERETKLPLLTPAKFLAAHPEPHA